ncbi:MULTISPECIES: DUF4233 domain-containing protein [Kocuria]|uniref:DUF4233 domain-containing protein n=1 Tax=Kocuria TaxID=57493 RepID=UPI00119CE74A|nr:MULTISPECIES: DUF4233 domain-containing protein [Kocuria]MCG7432511.1 DUF4233 domain-containing protein [Kocuria indica]MCT1723101.1 DUF4233 domain-containing protein [Kocuria marina]MCT1735037.1 DUF4233 domain-containing protein [Kocuria marina]GHD87011.1 hypothetical protein GCM10007061_15140 [Kocuria marina]
MARMTKAQREWRPGQPKKPRSIKTMFASSVLSIEAFIVFFAALAAFGLTARDWSTAGKLWLMGGSVVLALVFLLACGLLRKPWGYTLGWVLQVVLIATGVLVPSMFVIGVLCALAWWYAVVKGGAMDRENVRRAEEQRRWEAENPLT